jgi:2-polyprenyl-3-methyl-5-hydroxy-6-metoxy-1,4-benzoquinol methylase
MKVAGTPDIAVYLDGGEKASNAIRSLLADHGVALPPTAKILDFGCGCGRVLRWWKGPGWKDLPGAEVHGTDYNPDLVEWCATNLSFAKIARNQLSPPVAYARDTFDLIYALSVFTHLPESGQFAWMAEFRRILRPGGHLIVSTHGDCYLERLTQSEKQEFRSGKLVVRFGGRAGTNLCSTFHPAGYVRQTLAAGFAVIAHVPEGAKGNPRQDAWLFRKPDA